MFKSAPQGIYFEIPKFINNKISKEGNCKAELSLNLLEGLLEWSVEEYLCDMTLSD